jgi:EAL domain-containing protein (putative c-di-GMP-specific phosphodiesterase class I)
MFDHRAAVQGAGQRVVGGAVLELGGQLAIIAELAAIRDLGVKLHVDDVGTGYSALSRLQKLKMDVLKVDQSFTSELGNSHEGRVFFQAIGRWSR